MRAWYLQYFLLTILCFSVNASVSKVKNFESNLGFLTKQMKELNKSRKFSQVQSNSALSSIAKKRQALIKQKLASKDLEALRGNLLTKEEIAEFPSQAHKYLEQPLNLKGFLNHSILESFDDLSNSVDLYSIASPLGSFDLYTDKDLNNIGNAKVKASGYKIQDKFLAFEEDFKFARRKIRGPRGRQRVLVIMVKHPNEPDSLSTGALSAQEVEDKVFGSGQSVNEFYKEVSNGEITSISGDVIDWINIPNLCGEFKDEPTDDEVEEGSVENVLASDIRLVRILKKAVKQINKQRRINFKRYDYFAFIVPSKSSKNAAIQTPNCLGKGFTGQGTTGKERVKIRGLKSQVGIFMQELNAFKTSSIFSHELGHNFGLAHSRAYECGSSSFHNGNCCRFVEYGGVYSVMGTSRGDETRAHLLGSRKHFLGWLDNSKVRTIGRREESEIELTLSPIELENSNNSEAFKLIRIPMDPRNRRTNKNFYFIENRKKVGFDSNLNEEGLLIYFGTTSAKSFANTIDTTPSSAKNAFDDFSDPVLKKGESFTDERHRLSITYIDDENENVKVKINRFDRIFIDDVSDFSGRSKKIKVVGRKVNTKIIGDFENVLDTDIYRITIPRKSDLKITNFVLPKVVPKGLKLPRKFFTESLDPNKVVVKIYKAKASKINKELASLTLRPEEADLDSKSIDLTIERGTYFIIASAEGGIVTGGPRFTGNYEGKYSMDISLNRI